MSTHGIVDSGAFHHITGCVEYLQDVQDIAEYPMGLPNEKQTSPTKEGIVVLNSRLILNNVLNVITI